MQYNSNNVQYYASADMDCRECGDVFGRVVSSVSDQNLIITVMGKQFLVPPKSAFLLSDLSQITPLYDYTCKFTYMSIYCTCDACILLPRKISSIVNTYMYVHVHVHNFAAPTNVNLLSTARTGLYDLIVIDPPWENRSAIRGKK